NSAIALKKCGVLSSVHWDETLDFCCQTLVGLYRQHPSLAGFIIDEQKAFGVVHSQKATEVVGANAPRQAHIDAAAGFYGKVLRFAKTKFPEKLTLLFTEIVQPDDVIEACSRLPHLDYFGVDGRPWDAEYDRTLERGD